MKRVFYVIFVVIIIFTISCIPPVFPKPKPKPPKEGDLSLIIIEEDLDIPIVINFDGVPQGPLLPDAEMTVTTTTTPCTVDSYQWYLDDEILLNETNSSINIIGENLGSGTHKLALLVTKNDILGTEYIVFRVEEKENE